IHPEPPAAVVYAAAAARHGSRLTTETIARRFREAFAAEEEQDRRHGWRTSEQRELQRWRHIVGRGLDDVADPESCFAELFQHLAGRASWRGSPDAPAVLPELAGHGLTLGLASNYDDRLRSVLAGTPESLPLQHVVISSEVGWRKPAREFFAALCAVTHLSPQ